MPQGRGAAPSRKGGAASSKKAQKPRAKTFTWEGLKLKLPAAIPEGVAFDIVEAQAADATGEEAQGVFAILRTLRSILGPEQFMRVRYKLESADVDAAGLLEGIFGKYGMTLGKS